MKCKTCFFMACLLTGAILGACSQPKPTDTATNTATATPTSTPTATATATPTPTSTPTSTPTATPTPTPTSTLTPLSLETLLEVALGVMEEEPYYFEMEVGTTVSAEGMTLEMPITLTGDFQPPDRMQGTLSMEFLGITIETEMISIGDTTYVTNPETGEWEVSIEPAAPFSPEDFTGIDPAHIEDLVMVGEEKIDGTPVYHLEGTALPWDLGAFFEEVEGEIKVQYWIGVGDGRLVQSAVEAELSQREGAGGLFETGLAGTISMTSTLRFSDYGVAVNIEPPEGLTLAPTSEPTSTFEPGAVRIAPDGSGDYPDLKTAVEAVDPGAIIVLERGTYELAEPLDIDKALHLVGAVIPNPVLDLAEVAAGVMHYSVVRFLLVVWAGKALKVFAFAAIGCHLLG